MRLWFALLWRWKKKLSKSSRKTLINGIGFLTAGRFFATSLTGVVTLMEAKSCCGAAAALSFSDRSSSSSSTPPFAVITHNGRCGPLSTNKNDIEPERPLTAVEDGRSTWSTAFAYQSNRRNFRDPRRRSRPPRLLPLPQLPRYPIGRAAGLKRIVATEKRQPPPTPGSARMYAARADTRAQAGGDGSPGARDLRHVQNIHTRHDDEIFRRAT